MNKSFVKKYFLISGLGIFLIVYCGFFFLQDDNIYLKINKGIELFGRIYREVTVNYVDDLDPEKFMEAGIEGMLETLDPYTNYIDETRNDDIELIQTGKYGGIGISVGQRDGNIFIISLMEGYSAYKKGIFPGDKILEIDSTKVSGMKPDEIRKLVRGAPGTDVKLKIEREGEKHPLDFILQREEIQVKNVTYSGLLPGNIGYIKLERFSRTAGDEVRKAIKDLKATPNLAGLVLDLRNNPGGLLEAAFEVTKKFVPKNSVIVTTKGRKPETEKKFTSDEEPIAQDMPLVVLVNNNSASASEIVTGAIQDLDRGVVIGTKTFGKGLVQSVIGLSYNTSLKITTAKYYTPSGRCIQKIDYVNKGKDGVLKTTPDSLKKHFKTLNNRDVMEAGGISPDSIVIEDSASLYVQELIRKSMFFRFAVQYASENKRNITEININNNIVEEFKKYLSEKKFEYKNEAERKIDELMDLAKKNKYSADFTGHLDRLYSQVNSEKNKEFEKNKKDILKNLENELVGNIKGVTEQIAASLKTDKQVQAAIDVLKNRKLYKKLLNIKG
jgi:carboxyl-terminal processing protease